MQNLLCYNIVHVLINSIILSSDYYTKNELRCLHCENNNFLCWEGD